MVEDIWGWRRSEDGFRLYRTVFDAEPRKNGKSTKAAGIGCALTIGENEPGGEVYSIAGNEAQAGLVHKEAKLMVRQSPELFAQAEVLKKSILCHQTGTVWVPLPNNPENLHGLNPHAVIGDEVHAWKSREQYDVMSTAVGARRQPLEFYITTAGDNLQSLCWELWDYARKVRDGIHIDSSFLSVLFEASETDDPGDPATWAKCNPNLGVSIKFDYLQRAWAKAQSQPSAMSAFKRLHLNIWTEGADRWMPISVWNDGLNAAPIDEPALAGRPCYLGLDLAWKNDISALVAVFPPCEADSSWVVICRFFLPAAGLSERCKRDHVPYDVWAQNGLLTLTEGNVTDFTVVEAAAREMFDKYKAKKLGFDRLFAGATINSLTGAGYECVECGQGFMTTALPMAELDRSVHAKRFRHGGNKVYSWMASNVAVSRDPAGNMKPNKAKSTGRIDGIPATLNAMALALADRPQAPSPYAKRGLLILR